MLYMETRVYKGLFKVARWVSSVIMLAVWMGAVACAPASQSGAGAAAPKSDVTINVYNWGDYIDEEILDQFKEETGIRISYDTFASNEDMYTKIKLGGANYDIAIPSDYMVEKMIKEGLLEAIDYSNIPNIENIDERFKGMAYDPDGTYSVPYMWGTLGILYNTKMVDGPVESWDVMWDENNKDQIFMYDSMRDSLAASFKRLGYSLNNTNPDELKEAKDALIQQKPLVQAYAGDNVKDKMIGGEGAYALVYSGDAVYCIEENPDLDYVVPEEGSNKWFDAIVIPKGAQHKKEAEMFIDFLCRGDIALKNTEYIGYSTVNSAAFDMLPEEMQSDPVYWPEDEVYNKCEVFLDLGEFIKEYDKAWTEILAR